MERADDGIENGRDMGGTPLEMRRYRGRYRGSINHTWLERYSGGPKTNDLAMRV